MVTAAAAKCKNYSKQRDRKISAPFCCTYRISVFCLSLTSSATFRNAPWQTNHGAYPVKRSFAGGHYRLRMEENDGAKMRNENGLEKPEKQKKRQTRKDKVGRNRQTGSRRQKSRRELKGQKPKKRKFLRPDTIIIALSILAGIAMLIYPWASNYLMQKNAKESIVAYEESVADVEDTELESEWEAAWDYNTKVQHSQVQLTDPFDPTALTAEDMDTASDYNKVLNLNGDGIMGYIDIPAISVYLPIFHGTFDESLAAGTGHLSGSSLPIGGDSTHCVITGHTGLTSAKLFTDLTELEEGDLFFLHVLDETLAYEVVEIQVVKPDDTEPLLIQDGRDLVTLVTCTPYGVNTHRLFVTGERTEYTVEAYAEQEDKASDNMVSSEWMRSYTRAILIGLAIVAALGIVAAIIRRMLRKRRRKGRNMQDKKEKKRKRRRSRKEKPEVKNGK